MNDNNISIYLKVNLDGTQISYYHSATYFITSIENTIHLAKEYYCRTLSNYYIHYTSIPSRKYQSCANSEPAKVNPLSNQVEMPSDELPSTSFLTRQINSSTFLVVEDDAYGELPYIYAKLYPNYILITDTGCDSPRCLNLHVTSLRQYLETYPVSTNRDQPLNPNGSKEYLLLCTHCHYDHILGIPQFLSADPKIIASSFEKSFLRKNFPEHSLCKHVNAPTPSYAITEWARHMDYFSISGAPLRIQFLHTPGHTPDSLSWFDLEEQYLYVGQSSLPRVGSL